MDNKVSAKEIFGKNKWVLFVMAFFLGITLGMLTPIASTHMENLHQTSFSIGLITSAYFLFISLTSFFINGILHNKDLKKLILIGLVLTAISSTIFPFVSNTVIWFILMALCGIGISFYMIGSQTILQNLTTENMRATVSGVFSVFNVVGVLLSSTCGPMIYGLNSHAPFIIGGISLIFASIILLIFIRGEVVIPSYAKKKVFKKISIALYSVFAYALIETTLVSMYPVFLLKNSFTYNMLGIALGIFALGSVIGIVPITAAADKIGKEKALIIAVIITAIGLTAIIAIDNAGLRVVASFVAGLGVGPIYALSMALNAQNLESSELQAGTALFTAVYGIGSTIGPVLSSIIVSLFGYINMFDLSFLLFAVLIVKMIIDTAAKDKAGPSVQKAE
jgi:MFS family permease